MKKFKWNKIYPVTLGILALCWFLIRVIPKPSRATYPCQRAAFPIASAFVIWLTSLLTSAFLFVRFKKSLKEHKVSYAFAFFVLFAITLVFASSNPLQLIYAGNNTDYQIADWDYWKRPASMVNNNIAEFDTVAIVKSDVENASGLNEQEIELMVSTAIEKAGGIGEIINNGDYVILKPNLVGTPPTPTPEYTEVSGMATDWRVVKAVAKLVREINPDGKIYIVECSAATSTRDVFEYYNYTSENIPEVDHIIALEDSCGAFEDYTDNKLEKVFLDDNIRLYPDEEKPNLSAEFYINKLYKNADVVISIPVLKNHKEAVITAGVKNVAIGMTPPNIYGMTETFFGKWTKIDHSLENLNKWLHDYYLCRPVDFVVVDGLQGFDHGPVGIDDLTMEEMQHNMRLVIAGKKALSADAVCGHIMSLDPTLSNYMIYLDNNNDVYKVGTINSKFIRTLGEDITAIRDIFPHITDVVNNAIYYDYEPPEIEVSSVSVNDNSVRFTLINDDDLDKIELKVNGQLLDQICIDHFDTVNFEIGEEHFPVVSMTLIASDRFFNKSQLFFDYSSIEDLQETTASLYQNFPNPFSSTTNIDFELKLPKQVKLYISDLHGRLIETLVNEKLPRGDHHFSWSGNITSGTYLYTLEIEGEKITKRMVKK